MSVYLKSFSFPSENRENEFLHPKNLTPQEVTACVTRDRRAQIYKGSLYPLNVISATGLSHLSFDDVTILYGGNGCGKTTSLNVIAQKLGLSRESLFNTGRFFGDYIDMCSFKIKMSYDEEYRHAYNNQAHIDLPVGSKMITSDDIFVLL